MAVRRPIRGSTVEARDKARRQRRRERLAEHYANLMRDAARLPKTQLRLACDYLRAVANDLPVSEIKEVTREVAAIADRRNRE